MITELGRGELLQEGNIAMVSDNIYRLTWESAAAYQMHAIGMCSKECAAAYQIYAVGACSKN